MSSSNSFAASARVSLYAPLPKTSARSSSVITQLLGFGCDQVSGMVSARPPGSKASSLTRGAANLLAAAWAAEQRTREVTTALPLRDCGLRHIDCTLTALIREFINLGVQ